MAGQRDLQIGRLVGRDVDGQLRGVAIGALVSIDKLQLEMLRLLEVHRKRVERGIGRVALQIHRRGEGGIGLVAGPFGWHQARLLDGLIEMERERGLRALDGGDAARVFDEFFRDAGVFGIL